MDETTIKTIIDSCLTSTLTSGEAVVARSTDNKDLYWNYLILNSDFGAVGSIDFVPSTRIFRINTYGSTLSISDSYKQGLGKKLSAAINSQ